jgi:hypothetical protein
MPRLATVLLSGLAVIVSANEGWGQDSSPPAVPPPPATPTLIVPPPPPHEPGYDMVPLLLPEPPGSPWNGPHGMFAGALVGLAFPQFTRFSGFPTTHLDPTVSPEFTLGYRFGYGGSVLFDYRLLDTSGSHSSDDFSVHSRLRLNTWDIDYQSPLHCNPGGWAWQWQIGVRFADWEQGSRFVDPIDGTVAACNRFSGAGPHLGLSIWRMFDDRGLALFAKVDGAILVGDGDQALSAPSLGSGLTPITFGISGPETIPYLNVQAGVSWMATFHSCWLRLDAGYQYEQWWMQATGKNSFEAFYPDIGWLSHGPFIRCQIGF